MTDLDQVALENELLRTASRDDPLEKVSRPKFLCGTSGLVLLSTSMVDSRKDNIDCETS